MHMQKDDLQKDDLQKDNQTYHSKDIIPIFLANGSSTKSIVELLIRIR